MKERVITVLLRHAPELCRECGMLWFVFSALDRLVANAITPSWIAWNVSGSLVAYAIGIYIEARRSR